MDARELLKQYSGNRSALVEVAHCTREEAVDLLDSLLTNFAAKREDFSVREYAEFVLDSLIEADVVKIPPGKKSLSKN